MDKSAAAFTPLPMATNNMQAMGMPMHPQAEQNMRRRSHSAPPTSPQAPTRQCQRGADDLCLQPSPGENHNYLGLQRFQNVPQPRQAVEEQRNLCPSNYNANAEAAHSLCPSNYNQSAEAARNQHASNYNRQHYLMSESEARACCNNSQYQSHNTTNDSDANGGRRMRLDELFPNLPQRNDAAATYGNFEPGLMSTRCEHTPNQQQQTQHNSSYARPMHCPNLPQHNADAACCSDATYSQFQPAAMSTMHNASNQQRPMSASPQTPTCGTPASSSHRQSPQFSGRTTPQMQQNCPQNMSNHVPNVNGRNTLQQRTCTQAMPGGSPQGIHHQHSEASSPNRFQPRPFPQQAPPCELPSFQHVQIPPEMHYRPVVRPFEQPEPVWDGTALDFSHTDTKYRPLPRQAPHVHIQEASFGGPDTSPHGRPCPTHGASSRNTVSFRSPAQSIHSLEPGNVCPPGCEPVSAQAQQHSAMGQSPMGRCPMAQSSMNGGGGTDGGGAGGAHRPCPMNTQNSSAAQAECGQCAAAAAASPCPHTDSSLQMSQRTSDQSQASRGPSLNFTSSRSFNSTERTPDERFADRMHKIEIEELVMDKTCPGAIQATLDGQENFNEYAYELLFAGVLPAKPQPIDPITMIEAVKIRIELERKELNAKYAKAGSKQQGYSKNDVDNYFERRNKTEVNDAIAAFLKADAIYSGYNYPKGQGFSVDMNKTSAPFFGAPINMETLTGVTTPTN